MGSGHHVHPAARWVRILAVVLDAYSRKVIGWQLGRALETSLPLAALEAAIASRKPKPGLVRHSDRGTQYASNDYVKRLESCGGHMSMSRRRPRVTQCAPWGGKSSMRQGAAPVVVWTIVTAGEMRAGEPENGLDPSRRRSLRQQVADHPQIAQIGDRCILRQSVPRDGADPPRKAGSRAGRRVALVSTIC